MYIRNIVNAVKQLLNGEMLIINYHSGKTSKILKDDKIKTEAGDLVVTRCLPSGKRCIVIIDPAEVESVIIQGELL